MLSEEVGSKQPLVTIRTQTSIDTGLWWRRSPLWLLLMEGEVILLSARRRRYICRVPIEECRDSYYSHNSGTLVIAPAEGLEFNQIAMPVPDAVKVLRYLGIEP